MPELESLDGNNQLGGAPGAAEAASSPGTTQDEPFYSFSLGGKEETYKTKEDLDKAYRDSFMRQSDYTRKTQEHAKAVKEFERQRQEFDQSRKDHERRMQQYAEWDRLLKSRPEIERQLMSLAQQGASPNELYERTTSYADEKYSALENKLREFEEREKQRELMHQRDSIFSDMASKYEDFDPDAVQVALEQLSGDDLRPLIETIYFSEKGRKPTAEVEQKIVEGLKKKEGAAMLGGGGKPSSGKKVYTDPDEARQAAKEALGVSR